MKFRRQLRFHGLKRPRVRQTMNKYNLYNLIRQKEPFIGYNGDQTFFQQKWLAKGFLRGYHGEHIKEKHWTKMFSRRLASVVDMDPRYMAEFDGSEQAAGRGSGRHPAPLEVQQAIVDRVMKGELSSEDQAVKAILSPPMNASKRLTDEYGHIKEGQTTPYVQMTFAPQERRLDIAIFRALFASSVRQARQFCIHGAVKVNGKKMVYPAYQLNPGDMFQVNPDRVMFALGRAKRTKDRWKNKQESGRSGSAATSDEAESTEEPAEASEAGAKAEAVETEAAEFTPEERRNQIQSIIGRAKSILRDGSDELNVKRKQQLRSLLKQAKPLLSRAGRVDPAEVANDITQLMGTLELSAEPVKPEPVKRVQKSSDTTTADLVSSADSQTAFAETESKPSRQADPNRPLSNEERKALEQLVRDEEENPWDPSKPYVTPWRPRKFMSPFAFIPRYLEVNQNICSAVYLRHPVARRGEAEVPTPWSSRISQLGFIWYLRRR